jgi:hypothetical protein
MKKTPCIAAALSLIMAAASPAAISTFNDGDSNADVRAIINACALQTNTNTTNIAALDDLLSIVSGTATLSADTIAPPSGTLTIANGGGSGWSTLKILQSASPILRAGEGSGLFLQTKDGGGGGTVRIDNSYLDVGLDANIQGDATVAGSIEVGESLSADTIAPPSGTLTIADGSGSGWSTLKILQSASPILRAGEGSGLFLQTKDGGGGGTVRIDNSYLDVGLDANIRGDATVGGTLQASDLQLGTLQEWTASTNASALVFQSDSGSAVSFGSDGGLSLDGGIDAAGDINGESLTLPAEGPLNLANGRRVIKSKFASNFCAGRRAGRYVSTTNVLYVYDSVDIDLFNANASFVYIESGTLSGELYRVASVDVCAIDDVPFSGIVAGETYLTCEYSGAAVADQSSNISHAFVACRIEMASYYYGIMFDYSSSVRNRTGGNCLAIKGTVSANAGVATGLPADYTHTGIDVSDAYNMSHKVVYAGGSTIELVVWQLSGYSSDVSSSIDVIGVGSSPVSVSLLPTD